MCSINNSFSSARFESSPKNKTHYTVSDSSHAFHNVRGTGYTPLYMLLASAKYPNKFVFHNSCKFNLQTVVSTEANHVEPEVQRGQLRWLDVAVSKQWHTSCRHEVKVVHLGEGDV